MAKEPKNKKTILKYTANASVELEVQITDTDYEIGAIVDDFKYERAWVEGKPDKEGWRKLVYSADGRTGDPWQVGKIRITVGKLSNVAIVGS